MNTSGSNRVARHLFSIAKRVRSKQVWKNLDSEKLIDATVALCESFAPSGDHVVVVAFLYERMLVPQSYVERYERVSVRKVLFECFGRVRISAKLHVVNELLAAGVLVLHQGDDEDLSQEVPFTSDGLSMMIRISDEGLRLIREAETAAMTPGGGTESGAAVDDVLEDQDDNDGDEVEGKDDHDEEDDEQSLPDKLKGVPKQFFTREDVPASAVYFPDESIVDQFEEIISVASTDVASILAQYNVGAIASHYKPKRHQRMVILMSGAPGTGKTAAAYALASSLQRPLYRSSLDVISSSYIGQTIKNARSLMQKFKALSISSPQAPMLLLDECESILNMRGRVEQAADRQHNAMIDVMLEEIETFEGILILTTNTPQKLDPAFQRRIDYALHLPKTSQQTQRLIWQSALAITMPGAESIDIDMLVDTYDLAAAEIKLIVSKTIKGLVCKDPLNHKLTQSDLMQACERIAASSHHRSVRRNTTHLQFGFV